MEVDLTGEVALVHGEGRWGAAIAARLERSGARVVHEADGRVDMLVNADAALVEGNDAAPDIARIAVRLDASMVGEGGRIVSLGSAFGLVPAHGRTDLAAASAALFSRTRAAALQLAPRGIRVNAVAIMPEHRPHTPVGRAAQPDDAALAVLFLVAPAASYITGEILRVDGGWSSGFAREF